ncbi:MAG: DUF5671 domain-containing protein [Candidatus Jorgensenbacteria bacterium]|nr:DUF5671 domain-containing protein [Candidatus Jorgensenbacteria bacterium]
METIQEQDKKVSPKDVFLHLLAIITLYISSITFLVLIFQYINIYFPDALNGGYYAIESAYSSIRFAIATLVVVFPVYIFTTRFLNKSYESNPTKRNIRIRKWLVYFTLFVAALVVIGDLVTLIYNLLGGEVTIRFLLKASTVLFVVVSVFTYYFSDLKKYKTE